MTNVIVRDVADDDVIVLKQAAAAAGMSLQAYLAAQLHNEAARQRRQKAVSRMRARMSDRSTLTAVEIFESMETIRDERNAGARL